MSCGRFPALEPGACLHCGKLRCTHNDRHVVSTVLSAGQSSAPSARASDPPLSFQTFHTLRGNTCHDSISGSSDITTPLAVKLVQATDYDAQLHKIEIQGVIVTSVSSASSVTNSTVMVSSTHGGQMTLFSQRGTIVNSHEGQDQMDVPSRGGSIVSSRVGGRTVMGNSQGEYVGQLVNTSSGQLVSGSQLLQSSGGQMSLKAGQSVMSKPPPAGRSRLIMQGCGQKTIQSQNKQRVTNTGANQLVQVSPGGRDQRFNFGDQFVQEVGQSSPQFIHVQGQQLVQPQQVQMQGQQMVKVLSGQQKGHVQNQRGASQQVRQVMKVQGLPLVPGQQIIQVGGQQKAVLQAQGQVGGLLVGPVVQNPVIQKVGTRQASGQQSRQKVIQSRGQVIKPNQTIQGTQPLTNRNKVTPQLNSVSRSSTVTSASLSPHPAIKINPSTQFVCEWASCLKTFKTPKEVEYHAISEHCPLGSDDIACLWQRCDGMKRKRLSYNASSRPALPPTVDGSSPSSDFPEQDVRCASLPYASPPPRLRPQRHIARYQEALRRVG